MKDNKKNYYLLAAASLVAALSLIFVTSSDKKDISVFKGHGDKFLKINIGHESVLAEVVENDESRSLGLSNRKHIDNDGGMLFVFDYPSNYGFWMKDMNFPIDIIWLDENKNIVYIKSNAIPSSYPEVFYPNTSALYVLEVVSGFANENKLEIGDSVKF